MVLRHQIRIEGAEVADTFRSCTPHHIFNEENIKTQHSF